MFVAPLGQANVAHSETCAGVTGLLVLVTSLRRHTAVPNAQLRALNPHIAEGSACDGSLTLPTQQLVAAPASMRMPRSAAGRATGVSAPPRDQVPAAADRTSASEQSPKLFDARTVKTLRNSLAQTSTAAMHLNLICLGAELGYWQSLCQGGKSCAELARQTNCDGRYTKEWCLAMAAGGMLRYDEPTDMFSVWPTVRSAMQDTEQIISACDLSAVIRDRSRLLDYCRQDKSFELCAACSEDVTWEELCAMGGERPVAAGGIFTVSSPAALWSSLRGMTTAVKRLYLIGLGGELGYWRSLCSAPMGSSQLAQATDCDVRCAHEWCVTMVTSGLLEHHAASNTFSVPQRIQPVLSSTETLLASCNVLQLTHTPRLKAIYRDGGGISWGEFSPDLSSCTCSSTSATYHAALLPSIPAEISDKLKAGASIADVGCGQGVAACLLAEQFLSARVFGYDYHAPSIEAAAQLAERKGLKNVHFAVRPSNDIAADASHDILCFLDCFHDMSTATGAARHAHHVLKPDGIVFLVEPMAAARDSVTEQIKVPTAVCAARFRTPSADTEARGARKPLGRVVSTARESSLTCPRSTSPQYRAMCACRARAVTVVMGLGPCAQLRRCAASSLRRPALRLWSPSIVN